MFQFFDRRLDLFIAVPSPHVIVPSSLTESPASGQRSVVDSYSSAISTALARPVARLAFFDLPPHSRIMTNPVLFSTGPFARKVIRAHLTELQRPLLGRKYGMKDRRPIDPPPVARLQFTEIINSGTVDPYEQERPFFDIQGFIPEGFICHVDLIAMPAMLQEYLRQAPRTSVNSIVVARVSAQDPSIADDALAVVQSGGQSHVISNSSIRTSDLAGSFHIQGTHTVYQSVPVLLFPFGDLSVKEEGFFCLRYRVCDVTSEAVGPVAHPILAECWGGVFRIWSSREFPGLPDSTELTKHIGVYCDSARVNVRHPRRASAASSTGSRPAQQSDGDESLDAN